MHIFSVFFFQTSIVARCGCFGFGITFLLFARESTRHLPILSIIVFYGQEDDPEENLSLVREAVRKAAAAGVRAATDAGWENIWAKESDVFYAGHLFYQLHKLSPSVLLANAKP